MGQNNAKILSNRSIGQDFSNELAALKRDYTIYLGKKHIELGEILNALETRPPNANIKDKIEAAGKIAHELAGNAQNFGFETISKSARTLDEYIYNQNPNGNFEKIINLLTDCIVSISSATE